MSKRVNAWWCLRGLFCLKLFIGIALAKGVIIAPRPLQP